MFAGPAGPLGRKPVPVPARHRTSARRRTLYLSGPGDRRPAGVRPSAPDGRADGGAGHDGATLFGVDLLGMPLRV